MEELRLSQDIAQFITDGTMEGLTQYVKRRKEDARNMEISRAGAWLKGNYIDSAIARKRDELGIAVQHKMAGYSWEYLQFDIADTQNGSASIIVKNFQTLNNSINTRKNKLPDYLAKDSSVNIDILKKNQDNFHKTEKYAQLELLPVMDVNADLKTSANQFDDNSKFYVVGYTLGNDKNINDLKLFMPNPLTNSLIEVDDWTKYIVDAPIQPSMDDLEVLQSDKNIPESQYDDTANMKYEVADNDSSKESNN